MTDKLMIWRQTPAGTYACECSPRGDYRLVISATPYRDRDDVAVTSYEANAEWLAGGSDYICQVTSFAAAQTEAEEWAKEYEAQR